MDDEPPPLLNPDTGDAAARSLIDDVKRLVDNGRKLAEAEIAYQKARAQVAGQGAKGVLGWGALALALLFFVLMALVMGLLLALAFASPLGPWGALATVTLVLLALAALSGWVAARKASRIGRLLADDQADGHPGKGDAQ